MQRSERRQENSEGRGGKTLSMLVEQKRYKEKNLENWREIWIREEGSIGRGLFRRRGGSNVWRETQRIETKRGEGPFSERVMWKMGGECRGEVEKNCSFVPRWSSTTSRKLTSQKGENRRKCTLPRKRNTGPRSRRGNKGDKIGGFMCRVLFRAEDFTSELEGGLRRIQERETEVKQL